MSIEASDFPSRLRAQVHLQGAMLTEAELSHLWACYPGCAGTGQWDVRAYARVAPVGTREYRVMRGSSIYDVYRSAEPECAAAVRTALNELESQDGSWRDPRLPSAPGESIEKSRSASWERPLIRRCTPQRLQPLGGGPRPRLPG